MWCNGSTLRSHRRNVGSIPIVSIRLRQGFGGFICRSLVYGGARHSFSEGGPLHYFIAKEKCQPSILYKVLVIPTKFILV